MISQREQKKDKLELMEKLISQQTAVLTDIEAFISSLLLKGRRKAIKMMICTLEPWDIYLPSLFGQIQQLKLLNWLSLVSQPASQCQWLRYYEKGFGGLSGADKGIAEKLQSLSGSIGPWGSCRQEMQVYVYVELIA